MTAADLLALALPPLGLIVLANFGEHHPTALRLTWLSLGALIALALVGGTASAAILENPSLVHQLRVPHFALVAGVSTGVAAAAAAVAILPPVRARLAAWLPIHPGSTVHATAMVLGLLVAGMELGPAFSPDFLRQVAQARVSLQPGEFVAQGIVFAALALAGAGLWVRRSFAQTAARLGLSVPRWKALAVALLLVPLFVGLSCGVDRASQALTPENSQAIDAITRRLFQNFATPQGALLLGLVAGVSEELLFRGALVPRFGVVLSGLLFASLHSEYGISLQTADVFVLGVALGVLRERGGTTASILTHSLYDAGVGLLAISNFRIPGCG